MIDLVKFRIGIICGVLIISLPNPENFFISAASARQDNAASKQDVEHGLAQSVKLLRQLFFGKTTQQSQEVAESGIVLFKQRNKQLDAWAIGDASKVLPSDPPQLRNYVWNGENQAVSLQAAGNEFVAFQIILSPQQNLSRVNVNFRELRSSSGQIAAPHITLFREWYITVKSQNRPGSTGANDYPDALIPFHDPYSAGTAGVGAPFDLVAGRNQPVWIDIYVPPATTPGDYQGPLIVTAGRDTLARLTVKLKVWNFALPAESHLQAFADLYGYRFTKGEDVPWELSRETWRILQHYEKMAHAHRFVNGHWGLEPNLQFDQQGKLYRADWRAYDGYLGTVLDGSLFDDKTPPAIWEAPIRENWRRALSEEDEAAIRTYCVEIERHFVEKKWPLRSTFVYTIDEPKENDFPTIQRYAEAVHAGSKQLQFMLTYPVTEALKPYVDLWAIFAGHYYPPHVQSEQKAGKKAWFYQAYAEPFVGLEVLDTYGLAFCTWAWIAWKYKVDGVFFWASNFWSDTPYQQLDAYHGDGEGLLFYPGRKLQQIGLPAIDGPVSSYRMKLLRRGLQDYEYLWLLAQNGKAQLANETVDALIASALCQQYDPNAGFEEGSKYAGWWEDRRHPALQQWVKDPRRWYETRSQLGVTLDKIKGNP
jgi:Glycoside hydrolase 123, catalytic domain/Glycoside hydrolase 123 N-terminal domain